MTPRLSREVPCRVPDRFGTIARFVLLGLLATTFTTMMSAPRILRSFGSSKVDITQLTVNKYAHEAFPTWRAANPQQACPRTLGELNDYMNSKDIKDPYGNDYEMYCSERGIVVRSLGEDGQANTPDDQWSNRSNL